LEPLCRLHGRRAVHRAEPVHFTAQIRHFSEVWPRIDSQTLVILDEFGVGTDPSQGAALAQAVVDGLLERRAWVGAATHFPALKAYGLSREGVRAASVIFSPDTKKPLFKLGYDQVGASRALDVARSRVCRSPFWRARRNIVS
jgi:Mismatch repair ATPase (MutS family)